MSRSTTIIFRSRFNGFDLIPPSMMAIMGNVGRHGKKAGFDLIPPSMMAIMGNVGRHGKKAEDSLTKKGGGSYKIGFSRHYKSIVPRRSYCMMMKSTNLHGYHSPLSAWALPWLVVVVVARHLITPVVAAVAATATSEAFSDRTNNLRTPTPPVEALPPSFHTTKLDDQRTRTSGRNLGENQIFGGSTVSAGEYPYFVSLEASAGVYGCGGTLISANRVLTAAHCFFDNSGNFNAATWPTVRVGHTTTSTSDGQQVSVNCVQIHPSYTNDNNQLYYDVAVMLLSTDVTITTTYASLNSDTAYPSTCNDPITAIGFGYINDANAETSTLLKQTEGFFTASQCDTTFSDPAPQCINSAYHVCTSSAAGGACQGDSGGPIFDCNNLQVGVTSFGGSCEGTTPDLYAAVAPFKSWIDSAALSSSTCTTSYTLPTTFSGPCPTESNTATCPTASPVSCPSTPAPTTGAPSAAPTCSCFSETATVDVLDKGPTPLKDVVVGDVVNTGSRRRGSPYQRIYAWGHFQPDAIGSFLQIHYNTTTTTTTTTVFQQGGGPLEISPEHLVFLERQRNPVRADSIKVGDILATGLVGEGGATVTKVETVYQKGLYAPLTNKGTVMVNGIKVSSYIGLQRSEAPEFVELQGGHHFFSMSQHDLIHLFLSPFRIICGIGANDWICHSYNENGMPPYVDYSIRFAQRMDAVKNLSLQVLVMFFVTILMGGCFLLESTVFGVSSMSPVLVTFAGVALGAAAFFQRSSKAGKKEKTV